MHKNRSTCTEIYIQRGEPAVHDNALRFADTGEGGKGDESYPAEGW
ncbi:MAG: hypothetical protein IJI75_13715 [Solobacterium sp.]|nr:hypothetical protein [Solobacterium sp.]